MVLKSCVPLGETKPRKQRNKFEKTVQLLPFGKLKLTESDLIFSTHASDNCVFAVELDKTTGLLAYLQQ